MSVGHYLELRGARVIQTAELLLAGRAVHDLLAARAMGVLHGPAGSGKTFAAHVALDQLAVTTAWVQFPSRPSMLHVARRLYRELAGVDPPRANRFDLSEDLIALLAAREWLLIVDEAQWLNRECIEYLRHLHDHPEPRFAVLLIGGDGCREVLSREPMLRSRIYRRVRFTRMPLATVLDVIPAYHSLYRDAAPELLALIDDRYAHGCFREMGELHPQHARVVRRTERSAHDRGDRACRARAARRRQPRRGGMKPRVRIVRDLPDAPATTRYLNRLHCAARGVVVVRPTPGRGGSGIARDILTALGKRFRPGSPRAPSDCSRWPDSGYMPNAPDTSSSRAPTAAPPANGASYATSAPARTRRLCG